MTLEFEGPVIYWRGPAPFYFIKVPAKESAELKGIERLATYGWGVIPATVRVGETEWTTSLFPKDGSFLVPVRAVVRKSLKLEEGDSAAVRLEVAVNPA